MGALIYGIVEAVTKLVVNIPDELWWLATVALLYGTLTWIRLVRKGRVLLWSDIVSLLIFTSVADIAVNLVATHYFAPSGYDWTWVLYVAGYIGCAYILVAVTQFPERNHLLMVVRSATQRGSLLFVVALAMLIVGIVFFVSTWPSAVWAFGRPEFGIITRSGLQSGIAAHLRTNGAPTVTNVLCPNAFNLRNGNETKCWVHTQDGGSVPILVQVHDDPTSGNVRWDIILADGSPTGASPKSALPTGRTSAVGAPGPAPLSPAQARSICPPVQEVISASGITLDSFSWFTNSTSTGGTCGYGVENESLSIVFSPSSGGAYAAANQARAHSEESHTLGVPGFLVANDHTATVEMEIGPEIVLVTGTDLTSALANTSSGVVNLAKGLVPSVRSALGSA